MLTPLPEDLENAMALYEMGLTPMPQGYVAFHIKLALAAKAKLLATHNLHFEYMGSDARFDGLLTLHMVVTCKETGQPYKLGWDDAQQTFLSFYDGLLPHPALRQ